MYLMGIMMVTIYLAYLPGLGMDIILMAYYTIRNCLEISCVMFVIIVIIHSLYFGVLTGSM